MLNLTKIKIILLAVFIAINGFLVWKYIGAQDAVETSANVILGDAYEILHSKNITVQAVNLPKIPETVGLYNASNSLATKTDISSTVLGQDCYMKEINLYQNTEYNIWINGGKFDLLPIDATLDLPEGKAPSERSAQNTAVNWLKKHGIWTKTTAMTGIATNSDKKEVVVTFSDKLGDITVVDSYVSVWVTADGVARVEGRNWLNTAYMPINADDGTAGKIKTVNTLKLAELLVNFANTRVDTAPIEITGIEFGYFLGVRAPDNKQVVTTPAVRLTTSAGTFDIDAVEAKIL